MLDILPLVEFVPDPKLTEQEVAECIRCDPTSSWEAASEGVAFDSKSATANQDVFAEKLLSSNVSRHMNQVMDISSLP